MLYGHLLAATVMTLHVFQGRSSIASFSMLTSAVPLLYECFLLIQILVSKYAIEWWFNFYRTMLY